jgi:MOSC domain
MSPVRITLPGGTAVTSGQGDLEQVLSRAFGRDVAFAEARPGDRSRAATAEEYWPDMAGLDYRDTVTDFEMPAGTFFDIAVVHLVTTATIDHLRALYPQGRVEARRFRPNIVVSTGPDQQGFAENDWIGLWVPETVLPYATWAYSWIRPPSRSLRTMRIPVASAGRCARPAGGFCSSVRCGR